MAVSTGPADLAGRARVMLLASCVGRSSASPAIDSFERALQLANSSLTVHRLPERVQCLAGLSHVTDVLRYSAVWRSLKRMYAARGAISAYRAAHVLLTDADGLIWKPVDAAAIVAQSSTVWYADHRGAVPPPNSTAGGGTASGDMAAFARLAERAPRPDTNGRARQFCSLHPWASALSSTGWTEHAARMAIGRDWAAWEVRPAPELT
jgi:hypothetical protein